MSEELLFVVEMAFQITGRGCVLAPGAPTDIESLMVRIGSPIRLVTPQGKIIHTRVAGIEFLNYGKNRPDKISAPILLPSEFTKDQVPPGTKVYLQRS